MSTTLMPTRPGTADHMAQWEIHELRGILAWVLTLTALAEEYGLTQADVSKQIEARVERFHSDMLRELGRYRGVI